MNIEIAILAPEKRLEVHRIVRRTVAFALILGLKDPIVHLFQLRDLVEV